MIPAADAVVWTNSKTKQVFVTPNNPDRPSGVGWSDPIGAVYDDWRKVSNEERMRSMLETVIDLASQGWAITDVVRAFAEIEEFRALGRESVAMCRALTLALVGQCLEPDILSFDELLEAYAPKP